MSEKIPKSPIMKNTKLKNLWEKHRSLVLTTPKFLKAGAKIIVLASCVPVEQEVDGRYGKRKMYVVESREHGLIYVSPLQLVRIVNALEKANWTNTTVEL